MRNLTGYWTGKITGTNQGGVTINLNHQDDGFSGEAKIHEPALGGYMYSVAEGKIDGDTVSMLLMPATKPVGFFLGRVSLIAQLKDDNNMSGRWESEIGTEGAFSMERFDDKAAKDQLPDSNSVFIVHGHDDGAKHSVARFLEKLGVKPVILQEQISRGMTIIEKFEDFAGRAGFAVVLMTPDDFGYAKDKEESKRLRPRQNVILELGYFAAKLGRSRTIVLTKGDVEFPSDILGLVYESLDQGEGWKLRLARELKECGYDVDLNEGLA